MFGRAVDDRALTDLGNVILRVGQVGVFVGRILVFVEQFVVMIGRGVVFMVLPLGHQRVVDLTALRGHCVDVHALRVRVVDRHVPDAGVDPRTARLRSRYDDVVVVRKRPVAHAHVVGGARCNLTDAGVGFEVLEFRQHLRNIRDEPAFDTARVNEADVQRIERIFDEL